MTEGTDEALHTHTHTVAILLLIHTTNSHTHAGRIEGISVKQGAVTSSRLWAFSPDHGADVVSSHCTLGINQSCYGGRH